jgi:hypothetical protein
MYAHFRSATSNIRVNIAKLSGSQQTSSFCSTQACNNIV